MRTTEIINGKAVIIDWEFDSKLEHLKSNWWLWLVKGADDYNNDYIGTCQADGSNPKDLYADVEDIEMVVNPSEPTITVLSDISPNDRFAAGSTIHDPKVKIEPFTKS